MRPLRFLLVLAMLLFTARAFASMGDLADEVTATVMPEAKIILAVKIGATIDQAAILADPAYNAQAVGSFVVFERPLNYYDRAVDCDSDDAPDDPWPSTVTLRFALAAAGEVFVGAIGPDSDVLAVVGDPDDTIMANKDSGQRRSPFLDVDVRASFLTSAAAKLVMEELNTAGTATAIPATWDDFYLGSFFNLYNGFAKPLHLVEGAVVAFPDATQIESPYLYPLLKKWFPGKELYTPGTLKRTMNFAYAGVTASHVATHIYSNSGSGGEVTLDAVSTGLQTDCGQIKKLLPGATPAQVAITGNYGWGALVGAYVGAFVADSVTVGAWSEDLDGSVNPQGSFDGNPAPVVKIFQPGWQKGQPALSAYYGTWNDSVDVYENWRDGFVCEGFVGSNLSPYGDDNSYYAYPMGTGDVDGDASEEIVALAYHGVSTTTTIAVFNGQDCSEKSRWWNPGMVNNVALFDLDLDGDKEIIGGGSNDMKSLYIAEPVIFALDGNTMTGEAPPRLGGVGAGNELWYTFVWPGNDAGIMKLSFPAGAIAGNTQADGLGLDFTVDLAGKLPSTTTDDHGNDAATATTIALPGSASAEMTPMGDRDWFKLTVADGQTVTIDATGDFDTVLYLYSVDGVTALAQNDDIDLGTTDSRISYTFSTGGTYYFALGSYNDYSTGLGSVSVSDGLPVDDHGDTPATASLLSRNSATAGEIGELGDRDWFKFDVTAGEYLVMETLGNMDTVLRLYAADGVTLLYENDDYDTSPTSFIDFLFSASGTYFVEVSSYADSVKGKYSVNLRLVDDNANTPGSATPVTLGGQLTGNLEYLGDRDWFSFTVADNGRATVQTTGNTDTVLKIYDVDGTTLLYENDDNNGLPTSQITADFAKGGTYFVEVAGFWDNQTGQYGLSLYGDTIADDYANDAQNSQPMALDSNLLAKFDYLGDEDWFAVTAAVGDEVAISTSGTADTVLRLYDSNGATLLATNDDWGASYSSRIEYKFPVGKTVYVSVSGYDNSVSGAYGLSVAKIVRIDDRADSAGGASTVAFGARTAATIDYVGDRDWFAFDAVSGKTYTVETFGAVDTILYLYSTDGTTLLASNDDFTGALSRVEFSPTAGGKYFFAVGTYGDLGTGAFEVAVYDTTPNRAPVVTPVPNQVAIAGQELSLTFLATDPDGDALTYTVSDNALQVTGSVMTWKPAAQDVGARNVTLTVSDGALDTTASFAITVNAQADAVKPSVGITKPVDGGALSSLTTVEGVADDAGSGVAEVEIQVTWNVTGAGYDFKVWLGADNKWSSNEVWLPAVLAGKSWTKTFDAPPFAVDSGYTVRARSTDKAGNVSDVALASFNFVAATQTAREGLLLNLSLTPNTIRTGETALATGKLALQTPRDNVSLAGQEIKINVTTPKGEKLTILLRTADKDGNFQKELTNLFTQPGLYTLRASFAGDATFAACDSVEQYLTVGFSAGYAILVQGRVASREGEADHLNTTQKIYRRLIRRGFAAGDIFYLNYNDATIGWAATPSKSNLSYGIEEWARDKMRATSAPLYIILVNHGGRDSFYMDSDVLTPTDLDGYVTNLQNALANTTAKDSPIVIAIGACYSGTFIDKLSKPGRVVLTSSAPDELSHRGPVEDATVEPYLRGGDFFIDELFSEYERGMVLSEAFRLATSKTEVRFRRDGGPVNSTDFYFDSSVQHPLLDDNADRKGTNTLGEGADGGIADQMMLGLAGGVAPTYADIIEVTPTATLDAAVSSKLVWGKANSDSLVGSAWFELRNPSFVVPGETKEEQPAVDMTKYPLAYNPTSKRWENQCNGFVEPGKYELFYYAKDLDTGDIHQSMRSVVYKEKPQNQEPAAFDLLMPADGAATPKAFPLRWQKAVDPEQNPVTYTLEIARTADFANPLVFEELADPFFAVDLSLKLIDSVDYFWRVTAIDSFGETRLSNPAYRKFKISAGTNNLSGIIGGVVYDEERGVALENATVVSVGSTETWSTDQDGKYLSSLLSTSQTLLVSCEGYAPQEIPVGTTGAELKELNIALKPLNVAADTVAPTVTANKASGTYKAAFDLALDCVDGTGTGCRDIFYTLDGAEPTAYSTPYTALIKISKSGTVKFFAKDMAGNASVVQSRNFVVQTPEPPPPPTEPPASGGGGGGGGGGCFINTLLD